MDRVVSTRLDDQTLALWRQLAKTMRTSRKAVLKEALRRFAENKFENPQHALLEASFGAWKRTESPEEILGAIRAEEERQLIERRGDS